MSSFLSTSSQQNKNLQTSVCSQVSLIELQKYTYIEREKKKKKVHS